MFTIITFQCPKGTIETTIHLTCEVTILRANLTRMGYTEISAVSCNTMIMANDYKQSMQVRAKVQYRAMLDNQVRIALNS